MRQTVGILGTPIDILDTQEVLERLEQFIQERRFHQVATANTDFLINALSDPELRHILRNADLVMPDGMPVVWAARLMRSRLPERVTGADIVPVLAAQAARKGYRIYMLGGRPEIARQAKERLERDCPGIQIVGCTSPKVSPLIEMESEPFLADIERTRPDILLVAFGNPKQEKWIHLHRERLKDVPVCIGVGGTFDFLAGKVPRAPGWMQARGLEWIHRLCHEPRRLWRRYMRDVLQFGRYLTKQWWAIRHGRSRGYSDMHVAHVDTCTVISLIGDFNSKCLPRFQSLANASLDMRRHIVLDLQKVTNFDGEALGTLINLTKRAAHCGSEVRLFALPRSIAAALRRSQLHDSLFRISETVAQALANSDPAGLTWRVMRGAYASLVKVAGSTDGASVHCLEETCRRLLTGVNRLDLDLQEVTYADSGLLAMLYRLDKNASADSNSNARLRIVPGRAVSEAIARDMPACRFNIVAAAEPPADAVEECVESTLPAELTSVETPPIYAQGAGG